MNKWLLRGLVLAAVMIVVRLVQGPMINAFVSKSSLISIALLAAFVAAVFVWGTIDGHADAAAQPDPDHREDLAMIWLLAGLVAGVLSGAVAWIISLFDEHLYVGGLMSEVTSFAAFTALLVFLPAMIAVVLGRYLIDRNAPPAPKHGGDDHRADTDVFAAVSPDDSPA
jgi:hypothetical protein